MTIHQTRNQHPVIEFNPLTLSKSTLIVGNRKNSTLIIERHHPFAQHGTVAGHEILGCNFSHNEKLLNLGKHRRGKSPAGRTLRAGRLGYYLSPKKQSFGFGPENHDRVVSEYRERIGHTG